MALWCGMSENLKNLRRTKAKNKQQLSYVKGKQEKNSRSSTASESVVSFVNQGYVSQFQNIKTF